MKKFNSKELLNRAEMKKVQGGTGYGCFGSCVHQANSGVCKKYWPDGSCRCVAACGWGGLC